MGSTNNAAPGTLGKERFVGHKHFPKKVDWGKSNYVKGRYYLRTTSENEVLYWNVSTGAQVKSTKGVKDAEWNYMNTTLGWAVTGLWESLNESNNQLESCDVAGGKTALIAGDE